jgi:hypothetical protein
VFSARRVARQEGRAGRIRAGAVGLTCQHGSGGTISLHTVLPLTAAGPTGGGYSGRAVVLKTGAAGVPSPSRRVVWPLRQRLIGQHYPGAGGLSGDDVGLSPVSVISHCVPAAAPNTPMVCCLCFPPASCARTAPCGQQQDEPAGSPKLRRVGERSSPSRPKRATSRTGVAWPLRRRPLPCDAGCVPLRREFEQRFLDRHGPAQVGLARPFEPGPSGTV